MTGKSPKWFSSTASQFDLQRSEGGHADSHQIYLPGAPVLPGLHGRGSLKHSCSAGLFSAVSVKEGGMEDEQAAPSLTAFPPV